MPKKVARRTRARRTAAQEEAAAAADEEPPTNEAPFITSIPAQTAHPTQELIVSVVAFDPDGDPITFSLVNAPATASIDPSTGTITWTPAWSDLGSRIITVRASDDHGHSSDSSFQVTIGNAAPEISPLGPETAHPGKELLMNVLAFDPDGDAVTYALVAPPAGASIDVNTGSFSWVPGWGDIGSRIITFRACDPEPLCTNAPCQVLVKNAAPEIAPISDQQVTAGSDLCVTTFAVDPDGDPITYALVSAPTGAAVNGMGDVCWTPTAQQVGTHFITVRVSDPEPLTAETTFKVTVTAP